MPLGGGGLTGSPGAVTHALQADFSGTAFGGSPTWTDITGWWMSAGSDPGGSSSTIPWGRQDGSTTVESSTTSFTLNNADGRFTPGNVSSPYYPNVKRRVRMRETITDGSTTLTLSDGYVDSWTVTPQTNGPTLATVSLSDGFARLQVSTALRAMYEEEVLLDAPAAYYPLTETAGVTSFGDATGKNASGALKVSKYGAGVVTVGAAVDPTCVGIASAGTAVGFSNSTAATGAQTVIALPGTVFPNVGAYTLECWVSTTSTSGVDEYLIALFATPLTTASLTLNNGTVGFHGITAAAGTNDGKLHHIVATFSGGLTGTANIYVDGALASTSTSVGHGLLNVNLFIGGAAPSGAGFTGTIAHAAMYSTVLSSTRVAAHYSAGKTLFAGESTAAHFARLLGYRPNLGSTATGTLGTVGAEDTAGMTLGDALTSVATAEGGVIQTNRGTLALIGRSNWYDPATTVTLNAANGEVDLPTTWRDDTQALVNDVTVSRPNGADQRAVNTASTTGADGVAQTSISANLNSDRDAADMAGWLVAVGVREQLDSPTLTVNLYARSSAALTMAVCALKTYDVVTLTNLPASAPASTMTFQVQGGTYTVGADTFSVELYTTTMPPTTLRFDATATAFNHLDSGLVFAW